MNFRKSFIVHIIQKLRYIKLFALKNLKVTVLKTEFHFFKVFLCTVIRM
jgi:hypothetical protein